MIPHTCLLQVRVKLGKIDPYFSKLADAMVTWIDAWRMLNPSGVHNGSGKVDTLPNGHMPAPKLVTVQANGH